MNKFATILGRTGDKVMKARAESIAELAKMSQNSLVQSLTKRKIELEFKQAELLDMSPDNRYSLKPGKDFRAEEWTQAYQQVSIDLINIEIELGVARNNYDDLFAEKEKKEKKEEK